MNLNQQVRVKLPGEFRTLASTSRPFLAIYQLELGLVSLGLNGSDSFGFYYIWPHEACELC